MPRSVAWAFAQERTYLAYRQPGATIMPQSRTLEETCQRLRGSARHTMASRTPVPAGQLGEREWDGLHAALNWLKKTSVDVSPSRNYDLSIDSVNSEARKHLAAVETFENAFAASGLQLHPEARDRIGFFHIFVKYWRDAAANAAALGLGGDISCAYYGQHIELPEEVMVARKWFETAVRLTTADLINRNRVEKFVLAGANHVQRNTGTNILTYSFKDAATLRNGKKLQRQTFMVGAPG